MIKPTALGWSIFYALFVAAAVPIIGAARAAETDYQNPDTASSQGTYQKPVQNPWRKTKATFYGMPYDDGKKRLCADGVTIYKSDGGRMSGHRNPRPREETRPGGLLSHAGMSQEARLAVAYEEISAICRNAEMDRYSSTGMRAMAHTIKKELQPVWAVICELADARMQEGAK